MGDAEHGTGLRGAAGTAWGRGPPITSVPWR